MIVETVVFGDADAVLAHPITVTIASVTFTAFIGVTMALVRHMWRASRILDEIERRVLPHFQPPEPGEDDHSLPARVAHVSRELTPNGGSTIKDAIVEMRLEINELRTQMEKDHPEMRAVREARERVRRSTPLD